MPTATLSRFCAELSFGALPPEVVEKAKVSLLDFLRLAVAGAALPWGEAARRYARSQGAAGPRTVLYYGDRLSPSAAALMGIDPGA